MLEDDTYYLGTYIQDNYYIDSETLENGHSWGISSVKDLVKPTKPEKKPEKKPETEPKHTVVKPPSHNDILFA
jgi:hypothetical protein